MVHKKHLCGKQKAVKVSVQWKGRTRSKMPSSPVRSRVLKRYWTAAQRAAVAHIARHLLRIGWVPPVGATPVVYRGETYYTTGTQYFYAGFMHDIVQDVEVFIDGLLAAQTNLTLDLPANTNPVEAESRRNNFYLNRAMEHLATVRLGELNNGVTLDDLTANGTNTGIIFGVCVLPE